MPGWPASHRQGGPAGRTRALREASALLACAGLALLGAGPAAAAPVCSSAHRGQHPQLLKPALRSALQIRRVCATASGTGLEVKVTLAGDVDRALAQAPNVAVGVLLRHTLTRGRAASAAAGNPPLLLATREVRGRAHAFGSAGLPVGASARLGATLSFFFIGHQITGVRSVSAEVVVRPSSPRRRAHKASGRDSHTDGAFARQFFGGSSSVYNAYVPLPPPNSARSCTALKGLIAEAQAAYNQTVADVAKAPKDIAVWLRTARALVDKLCPPPATGTPVPPSPVPPISPVQFGSDLSKDPDTMAKAAVSFVLWLTGATAPSDGQITKVEVRGAYVPGSCSASDSVCQSNVHFQDLRPQADGSLQVISTTQAFTLPTAIGTYGFAPTNFFVKKGDYVGLATVGGAFQVLVTAAGAQTAMFQGNNQDNNGDRVTNNNPQSGRQLNIRATLQPH